MKITKVESFPVEIPLKPHRRMVSSLGQHTVSKYVLVRISTDAQIDGVGEATVMPRWSGETVWGTKFLIDQLLTPLLIGRDPRETEALSDLMDRTCQGNWFTKSALEMACWDIAGKDADLPVYELLGGAARPLSIRCRFSLGAYNPDQARRRTEELIDAGFTTIKVKVGTDPDADVQRVRIVREVIGPDREIVIDANCGWNAPTAIAACERMNDLHVALFEQPTTNGDYAALAEVRKAIRPQVMADDIVFDLVHAKECIRNDAADVISLYPGKNGGIGRTKRIVDYCGEHNVACSIGSNLELDIATAAMCHTVIACPNMQIETYPGDILGPEYHETSIATNPIRIEGPIVSISDKPGLGVDVDWDVVKQRTLTF